MTRQNDSCLVAEYLYCANSLRAANAVARCAFSFSVAISNADLVVALRFARRKREHVSQVKPLFSTKMNNVH